jgi:hypothetical protein
MSIKTKYTLARYKAKMPVGGATIGSLVAFQKALRVTVPQSPHYNDDPNIKANFDKWTAETDLLDAANTALGQALTQVKTQRTAAGLLHSEFFTLGESFMTTIQNVALGNLATLLSFGVTQGGVRGPAATVTVPLDLRIVAVKGMPGHYVVKWRGVAGVGFYEVQRSPDPPAEATYVTSYGGKSPEYSDSGTLGQVLWFRVRARGNVTSAWSTAISYAVH